MKEKVLKVMERFCTIVAFSAAFVNWPYCTLILNQPQMPDKLKNMNRLSLKKELEIKSECGNMR